MTSKRTQCRNRNRISRSEADGCGYCKTFSRSRRPHSPDFLNPSGYSEEVTKAAPLKQFRGSFVFFNGGLRLDKEVLDEGIAYRFKKVDNLLFVDTRNISGAQKHLNFTVSLLEPHALR